MIKFAFLLGHCAAWGRVGHERINRVAQSLLVGSQRDRIRHLLHSDVIDIAHWEDLTSSRNPPSKDLHWHRQEPEWTCASQLGNKGHIKCDDHSAEQTSLYCGLAYFFEEFASKAMLQEFPALEEPINTPKKLDVLIEPDLPESSDLRWLVTLMGDLHQPLHWLPQHTYGKEVNVSFRGEAMTLLELWETHIPRRLPVIASLDAMRVDYEARSTAWAQKVPTELFRVWAKEVAAIVCEQIYPAMEVNHADGTRSIADPFVVDEALYQRWLQLANTVLELGGQRIAFVLVDILTHKKHKKHHMEGRGIHRSTRWRSCFMKNVLLSFILVPSILALLMMHRRMGGPSLLKLAGVRLKD